MLLQRTEREGVGPLRWLSHLRRLRRLLSVSAVAMRREIQLIYLGPIRSELLPGLYFILFCFSWTGPN